jgi:hypothetical protein
MKIGDIMTWDYQSDIYGGQYRLIEDLGGGRFVAEYLEPSDEVIDRIINDFMDGHGYLDYIDPFGPNRRRVTAQESLDMEIMQRIERAGQTFKIQIVSAATYHAAF